MDKKYIYKYQSEMDLSSVKKLNSHFSSVKIRIAYAGKNRNRTIISKELLQSMADTSLKNVPIIGYYKEDVDNFRGHSSKIEITDEEIKFIDLTRPYGVIPTDSAIWWEDVLEKDGITTNSYLCTTGLLWSGRYSEVDKILKDGSHHSMELTVTKVDVKEDGYTEILEAEFSALCILGKDEDPEINVEPCFESASIVAYNLNKFKLEFAEMLNELKQFSLRKDNEVEDMKLTIEKRDEILNEFKLKLEDINFEITEDMDEEVFRAKLAEMTESKIDEPDKTPAGEYEFKHKKDYEDYSLLSRQKWELISNALHSRYTVDAQGDILSEIYYYLIDFDDMYAYAEVYEYNVPLAQRTEDRQRIKYQFDEAAMKVTVADDGETVISRWVTVDENNTLNNIATAYPQLKTDYDNATKELDELRQFKKETEDAEAKAKHEAEIDNVISEFEGLSEVEGYSDIKEKAYDMTVEELEMQFYILCGKNSIGKYSKQKTKETGKPIRVPIDSGSDGSGAGANDEPYGGLFIKYGNK